ncbi:hypothetical protein [Limibacillus sp. MBR-115]|uniref:hypothetical protein n=1 Tax=Limibacillus sp. MBR-115 TaxID=3156465 RepID=UPI00339750BD
MKALKVLVIGMAVLIVVGFAVIVFTIAGRVSTPKDGDGTAVIATPGPDTASWQTDLPLPKGCRLGDVQLDGGLLLVRLEGPSSLGCDDLLLVSPDNGRIVGRISPQLQEP